MTIDLSGVDHVGFGRFRGWLPKVRLSAKSEVEKLRVRGGSEEGLRETGLSESPRLCMGLPLALFDGEHGSPLLTAASGWVADNAEAKSNQKRSSFAWGGSSQR